LNFQCAFEVSFGIWSFLKESPQTNTFIGLSLSTEIQILFSMFKAISLTLLKSPLASSMR
jgi:hypothetical protein